MWDGLPLASVMPTSMPNRYISLHEAKLTVPHLFSRPWTLHHSRVNRALTQLNLTQGIDKLIWRLSASGKFSVRSTYKVLSQAGKMTADSVGFWKAAVTPSMKVFFFLFLKQRLLTHDVMSRRNIAFQQGCVMCDRHNNENTMHLFFSCPFAMQLWATLATFAGYNILNSADTASDSYRASLPDDKDRRRSWLTLFITAVWFLWRERNERTFRHSHTPVSLLANKIWQEVNLYLRYC